MTKPFKIKIASASCNQTGGDWPRNLANICKAIDAAVEDGADILSLEELGLTGYERGDDFYYSDNTKTRLMLQVIADYAASKDANLIISMGHPWYFADKKLPDQTERRKNPLFNRIDNQFNVQTLLTRGEVVSMSAKPYLFNYERGFEGRHFVEWSVEKANSYKNEFGQGREGTILIELPATSYANGVKIPSKVIPFGDPVVAAGAGDRTMNLYHVICEAYWIGSQYDGSPDNSDYGRDNPVAQKANQYDITVCINPNASPPAEGKIDKHRKLVELASGYCGVVVHTDGLGTSGSTFAQFGSRLMGQDGKIISEGVRASFKDMAYTSQVVEVLPPQDKGHIPHAVIEHQFRDKFTAPQQDGPAPWEKGERRLMEEEVRNELLWLFDYMRKNKMSVITNALSGGKDSAYNVVKVRLMVEVGFNELGVEGFFKSMSHLKYGKEVIDAFKKDGLEAAIDKTMEHMLDTVYMATDNSSQMTLKAARCLIEGGVRDDGTTFKGIGGKFHYRNIQRLVDVYAEIYAGVNPGKIDDARDALIRNGIADILRTRSDDTTPEEMDRRIHTFKTTFEEVIGDVLTISNPDHMISYENMQARVREGLILLFSNMRNSLAVANPNLDETRNSYATWGGDLHSGQVSGNSHKGKDLQEQHMLLLEKYGLHGIPPVEAFYHVNYLAPSAELKPLSKDGKIVQFDEEQLGRTYKQMNVISNFMLNDRPLSHGQRKNSPIEVFEACREHPLFKNDSIEVLHDRIRRSYDGWASSQFKIHAGPIAMTYGRSVDHQSSLRTPNIASFHKPELAQLAVYCLHEMAARDAVPFEKVSGGVSYEELSMRALIDNEIGSALSGKMWTKEAGGGKLRLASLYDFARDKTLGSILQPSPMQDIFEQATQYRAAVEAQRAMPNLQKAKQAP